MAGDKVQMELVGQAVNCTGVVKAVVDVGKSAAP